MRLVDRPVLNNQGKGGDFRIDENSVMRIRDRVCVPYVLKLKKSIIDEGHDNGFCIHPGAIKMYQDLKILFWYPRMKKGVSEFVYACLTCYKLEIEHQKLLGLMQPLSIPEWKYV